jgi:diguanylate cyclase (GGDEF)-like protein
MVSRSRSTAVFAAPLAALLIVCASAWGDSPLPVQTPDLPGSPSVGLTPQDNGVGLDLGVGDTNVHVGAGTTGAGVGVGARNSSPSGPRRGAEDSAPVSTPVLIPGRLPRRIAASEDGAGGTIFGPPGSSARSTPAGADRSTARRIRTEPTAFATSDRARSKPEGSRLPYFFDIIEQIPPVVRAGLVALGLITLALWAMWVRGRRRLAANAFVDPVTGIANAAAFTRLVDRELDRARRFKRPLGLLLVDVSEAERADGGLLNMRDTTLRKATEVISERIREAETVARLGENRFGVICSEATAASTHTLARALERRFEEVRIHVKVGVAEREATDEGADDLIVRAAAAMPETEPPRREPNARRALRAA